MILHFSNLHQVAQYCEDKPHGAHPETKDGTKGLKANSKGLFLFNPDNAADYIYLEESNRAGCLTWYVHTAKSNLTDTLTHWFADVAARTQWLHDNPGMSLHSANKAATLTLDGSGVSRQLDSEFVPRDYSVDERTWTVVATVEPQEPTRAALDVVEPVARLLGAAMEGSDLSDFEAAPFTWPATGAELVGWAKSIRKKEPRATTLAGPNRVECTAPFFTEPEEGAFIWILSPSSVEKTRRAIYSKSYPEDRECAAVGWFPEDEKGPAQRWAAATLEAYAGGDL